MSRVITARGGELNVSDDVRRMLALFSDGTLWVSESHRADPRVKSALARFAAMGRVSSTQYVSMAEIDSAYREHSRAADVATGVAAGSERHLTTEQSAVLRVMREAIRRDVSDVHIFANRNGTSWIKYRVRGRLVLAPNGEMTYSEANQFQASLYQTMCDVAETTFYPDRSQDARLKADTLADLGLYGARVATRPQGSGGLLMVLRMLKVASGELELSGLGYTAEQEAGLTKLVDMPTGITLIAGPTGSGKSRTLQVLMALLVKRTGGDRNILTFENPIEYEIPGAIQTVVVADERSGLSPWENAIRNGMRLDPDYMMIGELRDRGGALAAFEAAMTGHGVFTTTHANDAFLIPSRLIGEMLQVSPEIALSTSTVNGLVAQRLVPLLCPSCRIPLRAPGAAARLRSGLLARLQVALGGRLDHVHIRGDGCERCQGTGDVQRTVVAEVVPTSDELFAFYMTDVRTAPRKAREWWIRQGGTTMLGHAIDRVRNGEVDPGDVEKSVALLDSEHTPGREGLRVVGDRE